MNMDGASERLYFAQIAEQIKERRLTMPNDDLISKKQVINFLKTLAYDKDMSDEASTAICMAWGGIDRMLAVDAEPVKYGKWRKTCFRNGKIDLWSPTYECSECHYILFGSPRTNY